jgi:polyisoprenoid-binding protein YceI
MKLITNPNSRRALTMKRCIAAITMFLLFAVPFLTYGATWQVDPNHSSFEFKIRHLTVSNVKGTFTKPKAVITLDDQDVTKLKIEVTIDAASVNTGNNMRDDHLRGADFFDVAKFPEITFVSKKATRVDADRLKVTGDLTIHGVTREITMDVEGPTPEVKDPSGNFRRGATATGKINRKDFGLTWNRVLDAGGVLVGEEVNIYVEVELIKK